MIAIIFIIIGVASYCCSRYFGAGYGPVVYDQVQCSSAESTLLSCNSLALGTYTGCNGNQDAGIGCYGKGMLHPILYS